MFNQERRAFNLSIIIFVSDYHALFSKSGRTLSSTLHYKFDLNFSVASHATYCVESWLNAKVFSP